MSHDKVLSQFSSSASASNRRPCSILHPQLGIVNNIPVGRVRMCRVGTIHQWGTASLYHLNQWALFTNTIPTLVLFSRCTRQPTTQIPPIIPLIHQLLVHTTTHLSHRLALWVTFKHRAIAHPIPSPVLNPLCLTPCTRTLHRTRTHTRRQRHILTPTQTLIRSRKHQRPVPCTPFRDVQDPILITGPLRPLSVIQPPHSPNTRKYQSRRPLAFPPTIHRLPFGLSLAISVLYRLTVNTIWNDIEKLTPVKSPSSATAAAGKPSQEKMR